MSVEHAASLETAALPRSVAPLEIGDRRMVRRGKRFGGFVLSLLGTVIGLTAVTFVIGRVVPIDPVLAVVGDRATPAVYEKARLSMGLDEPIVEQYGIDLESLVISIEMDAWNSEPWSSMAQSLQSTMGQAGIKISILSAESKQVWTKFRARQHQMLLIQWSPDYLDPHSNSDTFCHNTENADASKSRTVAWRNHWDIPELSKQSDNASREKDTAKREADYIALQKSVMADSPYLFMFEPTYQIALRKAVKDFVVGPYWDLVFYRLASK